MDQALARNVSIDVLARSARALGGVPTDALAIKLGTTRNALYKTMFDARRKLRAYLVANGYLAHDEAGRS